MKITISPSALAELQAAAARIDTGSMPNRAPGATVQRGTTRQPQPQGRRAGGASSTRRDRPRRSADDDPEPARVGRRARPLLDYLSFALGWLSPHWRCRLFLALPTSWQAPFWADLRTWSR